MEFRFAWLLVLLLGLFRHFVFGFWMVVWVVCLNSDWLCFGTLTLYLFAVVWLGGYYLFVVWVFGWCGLR